MSQFCYIEYCWSRRLHNAVYNGCIAGINGVSLHCVFIVLFGIGPWLKLCNCCLQHYECKRCVQLCNYKRRVRLAICKVRLFIKRACARNASEHCTDHDTLIHSAAHQLVNAADVLTNPWLDAAARHHLYNVFDESLQSDTIP